MSSAQMLNIEAIDAAHAIGTSDAAMLCLWRTATTYEAVIELQGIAKNLVASSPGKVGFLTVVEAGADLPDGKVRDELAKMFQMVSASVACSALCFEGEGFRAAAVRAITTTINQVARQPFPHKVFGRVDEASRWMQTHNDALSAIRLGGDMTKLRRALDDAQ